MGGGGVPRGGPPSHAAYYVALAGIFGLLMLLCCYFCYFFIKKVKELSEQETPSTTPSSARPSRGPSAYPVQPVVRDSATAMAKLCKQLPQAGAGKGGTVFPTSTSPAALQTDTGELPAALPSTLPAALPADVPPLPEKLPPPAAADAASPPIQVEASR